MNERTVKHVQLICEKNVLLNGRKINVGMEKLKSERIVRIVKRMYENVVRGVEMER
jgi:ribosomal protein S4